MHINWVIFIWLGNFRQISHSGVLFWQRVCKRLWRSFARILLSLRFENPARMYHCFQSDSYCFAVLMQVSGIISLKDGEKSGAQLYKFHQFKSWIISIELIKSWIIFIKLTPIKFFWYTCSLEILLNSFISVQSQVVSLVVYFIRVLAMGRFSNEIIIFLCTVKAVKSHFAPCF